MAFQKKESTKKVARSTNGKFIRYEETKNLAALKMVVSIVPLGQATGTIKMLEKLGVNYSVVIHGEGTGKQYVPNLISENKKSIILSFVREDIVPVVMKTLKKRFSVSKAANGIAFSVRFTSVMGVSIYKFLSNTRKDY